MYTGKRIRPGSAPPSRSLASHRQQLTAVEIDAGDVGVGLYDDWLGLGDAFRTACAGH
jgi:hypothetical protein